MRLKILWAVTFWLLPFSILLAQKYDNYWTFADSAGIDFIDLNNPKLFQSLVPDNYSTGHTQASISDSSGNMLFYLIVKSASEKIFNRGELYNSQNLPVVNGDSLMVSPISNAIILPMENDNFLLMTISIEKSNTEFCNSKDGFCSIFYHLIEKDNSNGIKIKQKNKIALTGRFSHHIASIRHSNGKDWWILLHGIDSNKFFRILVKNGMILGPWEQSIGRGPTNVDLKFDRNYWGGEMIFSPLGNKLAICCSYINVLELFDFDRCTGLLSNVKSLEPKNQDERFRTGYHGFSFSPDGSKLYVSKSRDNQNPSFRIFLHVHNLDSLDQAPTLLHSGFTGLETSFCLHELGPDNKIYIARLGGKYLSVINDPNKPYPDCNFVNDGFYLEGKTC